MEEDEARPFSFKIKGKQNSRQTPKSLYDIIISQTVTNEIEENFCRASTRVYGEFFTNTSDKR